MSRFVLKLALALLPPSRKAWGDAMKAEFAYLSNGQNGFAWGCLGASIKENVMTGEGWARIGFFGVQGFAFGVAALWLIGLYQLFGNPRTLEIGYYIYLAAGLSFGLIPASIFIAARKANKSPSDRFHISRVGVTLISNLAFALSLSFAIIGIGVQLACFLTPRCATADLVPNLIGIFGIFFFAVGMLAKRGAKAVRNTGAWATSFLFILCSTFFLKLPIATGAEYRLALLILCLPMILMAIAGAILMWMERPAHRIGQT